MPSEVGDYRLFLSMLKKQHLIADYKLSEDGAHVGIKPIKAPQFVFIDFDDSSDDPLVVVE